MPNGSLIYLYRDGESGNGNLVVKSYNIETKEWANLQKKFRLPGTRFYAIRGIILHHIIYKDVIVERNKIRFNFCKYFLKNEFSLFLNNFRNNLK